MSLQLIIFATLFGSSAGAPPSLAELKKRAKRDIKTAVRRDVLGVRVGGDRLRGNVVEAAGVVAGGALVFAGAWLSTPALCVQTLVVADRTLTQAGARWQGDWYAATAAAIATSAALLHLPVASALVPWLVIGGVSARACEGALNSTSVDGHAPSAMPPLAAVVALVGAAQLASRGPVSVQTLASALLGGLLLVECSLKHLRNELDQIVLKCATTFRPLLQGGLAPLASGLRTLRRVLLPLPTLVKNQLNVRKTATRSAVAAAEAAFDSSSPRGKVAAIAFVGAATQTPLVQGTARPLVGKSVDASISQRIQATLPAFLRERNITGRVRRLAEGVPPFQLAVSTWTAGKRWLMRSARWALPYFFAGWGCAVQCGQLRLFGDAPRVLVLLIPLKWGQLVPEPMPWLLAKTKDVYRATVGEPIKRALKRSVGWVASHVPRVGGGRAE